MVFEKSTSSKGCFLNKVHKVLGISGIYNASWLGSSYPDKS